MAKARKELCPICGNVTEVNTKLTKMQCKFCKRWFSINKTVKGKRVYVDLRDISENSPEASE